jgi:hypothetical protein
MKVALYWPDCTLLITDNRGITWSAKSRTVFWVGAELSEAIREIKPHLTAGRARFALFEDPNAPENVADTYLYEGRYYFLVGQNLDMVAPFIRVYPYSGMWNGNSPFLPIGEGRDEWFGEPGGLQIESLKQLQEFSVQKVLL